MDNLDPNCPPDAKDILDCVPADERESWMARLSELTMKRSDSQLTNNQMMRLQRLRSYLTVTKEQIPHEIWVNIRAWLILIEQDE